VAVIKTEIEGALRCDDLSPDVRAALVAAVEECDHLSQLAEDLLVIARAADGKLPVRPEEIRIRSALGSVRARFTDRAREHGRPIVVEAPEDLLVHADPLRLRQALGNLTDNALRHGMGQITLSARRAASGVAIEVADEGPGFEEGVAGRAFERFARGDAARTRGGAGLGMAIVQAVADAHGGCTEIPPAPNTTVRLWFPAVPEPARVAY
jgi:two-component system sensor histidine kinase BaeS